MKVAGIIFDKDGTLIDFYKIWLPAAFKVVDRIFDEYDISCVNGEKEDVLAAIGISNNQIEPNSSFAWKTYHEIAEDMQSVLERVSSKTIDVGCLAKKLEDYFEDAICKNDNGIESIIDLPELMEWLVSRNIKIGIATTDTYKVTMNCLKQINMLEYISFFAMDQMPNPMPLKPDGELINKAASYWEVKPEQILVVGDTLNDMKFAHNGGAIAVGVLSGVSKEEDLQPQADYIMESIANIPDLVYKLEKKG